MTTEARCPIDRTALSGSESGNRSLPGGRPHFNPGMAVRRLVGGEPVRHVFERDFGWPLVPLDDRDINRNYTRGKAGYKKAVVATLLAAKTADTAHNLGQSRPLELTSRELFSLDTSLGLFTATDFSIIWLNEVTSRLRREIVIAPEQEDLLKKVTAACQEILTPTSMSVRTAMNSKVTKQVVTAENFLPPYLLLLPRVYVTAEKRSPYLWEYCEMVDNSYPIVGRPASGDITYMVSFHKHHKVAGSEGDRDFIPDHYELKRKTNGTVYVALKDEYVKGLGKIHRQGLERERYLVDDNEIIDLTTGCPANADLVPDPEDETTKISLIDMILRHYTKSIRAQAT